MATADPLSLSGPSLQTCGWGLWAELGIASPRQAPREAPMQTLVADLQGDPSLHRLLSGNDGGGEAGLSPFKAGYLG